MHDSARYGRGAQPDPEAQLAAISEVLTTAAGLGISVWLRGGWAMDFYLGRVTRSHRDIDWFVLVEDAELLRTALLADGFVDVTTAPAQQQLDLHRGSIDHGFALVRLEDGVPVVAGGPWGGAPWPAAMLGDDTGRIGEVRAPFIRPEAQIEIKMMMPVWNPAFARRQKDLDDVAALSEELGRGQDGSSVSDG